MWSSAIEHALGHGASVSCCSCDTTANTFRLHRILMEASAARRLGSGVR